METQNIEVKKLEKSPLNVRRTIKREGLEELKASILSHGLMQNLVVTANGSDTFYVVAGARRLAALKELQQEGKLPPDYTAPCQLVSEEQALEKSLAENTIRHAMHPADEFEAFLGLAQSGQTAERIAERFGVTEKHVQKRLQLARVTHELLAEYRAGNLDLETLMAFTLTDSRKRQMEVYESLRDWDKNPHTIRQRLTEEMISGDDKRAQFIGLEAYTSAAGKIRSNLFGDEVYFEDADLLNNLVAGKLEVTRKKLLADGWGWVEVNPERDWTFTSGCGRIRATPTEPPAELVAQKEAAEAELKAIQDSDDADYSAEREAEAKLYAIEQQLEQYVAFDADEMKTAGCYITLDHDGQLDIERGLVRKQDQKQLKKEKEKEKEAKATKEEAGADISQTLRQDLELYRLQVAQVEIAEHPAIAFDLLVFNAVCDVLDKHLYDGPDVAFNVNHREPSVCPKTKAGTDLKAIADTLPLEWLKPKNQADQFEQFRQLTDAEKLNLLAYLRTDS